MVSQFLMIFTLVSIWISLIWGVVILVSGVHFWLKHSDFKVDKKALPYYPKVTMPFQHIMKMSLLHRLQSYIKFELST